MEDEQTRAPEETEVEPTQQPLNHGSNQVIQPPVEPANPGVPQGNPSPTVPTPPQATSPAQQVAAPAVNPVGQTFLTGSQIQEVKKQLPIGVYVIAGYCLLGFITSFFDSSQNSIIFVIAMLLNLLLAIGLIVRQNAARMAMLVISGLIVGLSALSIIMLTSLQGRMDKARKDYKTAISRIDQSRLTAAQKKQLDGMTAQITSLEQQAGKAITFTYVKLGVAIVANTAIIIYLSRPKVVEAFTE